MEQKWTATLMPTQEATSGANWWLYKSRTVLTIVCWPAHTKHPVLAPVPIYHPTHCRAQSVWPQLLWKANPLILSLQAAGRSCRTISPPTIKNHITEGSGAGPAFHHSLIYRVSGSPRRCNQPHKAQEPSSYQPGPQMPIWHPY